MDNTYTEQNNTMQRYKTPTHTCKDTQRHSERRGFLPERHFLPGRHFLLEAYLNHGRHHLTHFLQILLQASRQDFNGWVSVSLIIRASSMPSSYWYRCRCSPVQAKSAVLLIFLLTFWLFSTYKEQISSYLYHLQYISITSVIICIVHLFEGFLCGDWSKRFSLKGDYKVILSYLSLG